MFAGEERAECGVGKAPARLVGVGSTVAVTADDGGNAGMDLIWGGAVLGVVVGLPGVVVEGENAEALGETAGRVTAGDVGRLLKVVIRLNAADNEHRVVAEQVTLMALSLLAVVCHPDPPEGRDGKNIDVAV